MATALFDQMGFPAEEVSKLTGLSVPRLREWQRGLVKPGMGQLYNFRDLVELRTLTRLIEGGLTTRKLRQASEYLRKFSDRPWSELKLGVSSDRQLALWHPDDGAWATASGKPVGQFLLAFAVDEVEESLKREVSQSRKRPSDDYGRIVSERGICGSRLRFAGTRVTLDRVVQDLKAGRSQTSILKSYPTLVKADVEAAKNFSD